MRFSRISHCCWSWIPDVTGHCFQFLPHSAFSVYEVCPCWGYGSSSFFLLLRISTLWVSHYVVIGFWLVGMWVTSGMWSYECSCMHQAGNRCSQFLLYRSRSRLPDMGKCYALFLEETAKQISKQLHHVLPCKHGYWLFCPQFSTLALSENGNHLLGWRLQWQYYRS